MNKNKISIFILLLVVVILASAIVMSNNKSNDMPIKIGLITDLTGPAAYWGDSTKVGAQMAVEKLKKDGVDIEVIFEDYNLDATKALNSAQKLVNIDNVQAIYAEFNPAAISVGSFLKGKDVLYVYDAAVASPLQDSPYTYKTYLDYKEGCKAVAEKFKQDGITKIGVLKVNLEFGDLCLTGVKEVYDSNIVSEEYNLGTADFKTQLLKIKSQGAGAVVNVGFEGDTYNTLKVIRDYKYSMRYGTVDDTVTDKVKSEFTNELKDGYSFGFVDVDDSFSKELNKKLNGKKITSEYGAALAYTHIIQMTEALIACDNEIKCASEKMNASKSNKIIGFKGFNNRVSSLDMMIKKH